MTLGQTIAEIWGFSDFEDEAVLHLGFLIIGFLTVSMVQRASMPYHSLPYLWVFAC